jgi:small subunit ribosomal protein S18
MALKKKKRNLPNLTEINYKNVGLLSNYVNEAGKIVSHKQSGFDAKRQRLLSKAVKRARVLGLLSFTRGT